MNNFLDQANHLLSQREGFQKWTNTSRTARWHRKLFARKWINMLINFGLLGASCSGFAAALFVGVTNYSALLGVGGFVSCAVLGFLGLAEKNQSVVTYLNPIINRESKKFGVWFKGDPCKNWGLYSKEDKIHLLHQIAQLNSDWKDVSVQLLAVINTDNLPPVWWEQMSHVIDEHLRKEKAQQHDVLQEQKFAQLQLQIQSVSAESVEVQTDNMGIKSSHNAHIRL